MKIRKLRKDDDRKFKIFTPINTSKSLELEEDGTLLLEGVASDTSLDLQYDVVTEEAIVQMKEQAEALNIHGDHDYSLFGGVIGSIEKVLETDDDLLKISFKIAKGFAEQVKDLLNAGVKLGLSIGGDVQEFQEIEDPNGFYGWEILAIKLYEISLVALPANWNTFGTVSTAKGVVKAKCLAGACYQILKNNGVKIMKKNRRNKGEEGGEGTEGVSESEVSSMINEAIDNAKEDITNAVVEAVKDELKDIVEETINSNEGSGEEGGSEGEGENKGMEESGEPVPFTEEELKALKEKIEEEVRSEILKEMGDKRAPEHTPQPGEEGDGEEPPVNSSSNKRKKYSPREIAESLTKDAASTGIAGVITAIANRD